MKKLLSLLLLVLWLASGLVLQAQVPGATWISIKTPMGKAVNALVNPYDAYITNYVDSSNNAKIKQNNWKVTVVDGATSQYQCHGYAWSMYNGGPMVEINDDVAQYYANDAVIEVPALTTTNWVEGVVILYGNKEHSAVTTNEPGYVISKWWYGARYKHKVNDCPWGNLNKRYFKVPLTGNDKICTYGGSANYTTVNITNAQYSWSVFNTTVPGNSSSVNISNQFYPQSGWIKVSITSPHSNTTIKSWKKLCVGESNSGYVPGFNYSIWGSTDNSSLCPFTDYTIYVNGGNAPCSASNFTWTVPYGYTINYVSGNTMSFNTGYGGYGEIIANANVWCTETATNCCPPAPGANVIVVYASVNTNYPYCSSWSMSVSPNPANDYIEVEATNTDTAKRKAGDETYQLVIYNHMRQQVYAAKNKTGRSTISLRQLPNGIYTAHLVAGSQLIMKRFIVNH
jgi:hypothetical protein